MNAASLTVLDSPGLAQQLLPEAEQILSLELGGVSLHAHLHGASLGASASVYDITAHDLCTHGSGVSEVLLARWHAGGQLHQSQLLFSLGVYPYCFVSLRDMQYVALEVM